MVIPHGGGAPPNPHAHAIISVGAHSSARPVEEFQIPLNAKNRTWDGAVARSYRTGLDLGSDSDAGHARLPSDLPLSHVQLPNVLHWFNRAK